MTNPQANLSEELKLVELALNEIEAGKIESAINYLKKSLQVKENHPAYSSLGDIFFNLKQWQDSYNAYMNALRFNALDPFVYKGLGMILYYARHLPDALNNLQKSLELEPRQANLNYIIANILLSDGQNYKSLEYFKKEIELGSSSPELFMHYGEALQRLGMIRDAVEYYKKGLRMRPTKDGYSSLMHIVHHDYGSSNADFKELTQECYRLCLEPIKKQINRTYSFSNRVKDPSKKIRLGFFSYRFRFAAADYWALKVFKEMNKDKFEIFLYHDSKFEDHGTPEFKASADTWREVAGMPHETVADLIYKDEIDILVDMIGHMGGGRLELFTLKPAPIQVCWLNYYGTLGMPEMDYFIADSSVVTPESEKFFLEKVYKMPKVFNPFTPKGATVAVNITEQLPFEKNGYITFGSLNRFSKINDKVLEYWAEILKQVPSSKLLISATVFKEIEMQEYIKKFFEEHGVDRNRIKTEDYPELREFFLKFNEIDICLDTFPFVGGATTIDATYMGVPTITIAGDTWVYRSGVATYVNVKCEELIVNSKEEAVQKTIELAADIDRLKNYRKTMREKLLSSPICDSKQYARDFEEAFKYMWQEFCNGNN